MTFTEKIVVGQNSGKKAMYSGKVIYKAFTENSFKFMQGSYTFLYQKLTAKKIESVARPGHESHFLTTLR